MPGTDHVIAVTSSKGGVLKTSIVANVAGLAAAGGWRVLCIDADPQGNLAHDLGYLRCSDHGSALARSITHGEEPTPLTAVRPGLDVLPGGTLLRDVLDGPHRGMRHGGAMEGLTLLADRYDVVLIDTPPGDVALRRSLTAFADYSVVPTAPDAASMQGLVDIARDLDIVRTLNPGHALLAVVLGPISTSAREIRRHARHTLSQLLGRPAPVLMATIRLAQRVAVDCRASGQLVMEYEADATRAATPAGWRRARDRRTFSRAAVGLAEDYAALTDELLERLLAARTTSPAAQAWPRIA